MAEAMLVVAQLPGTDLVMVRSYGNVRSNLISCKCVTWQTSSSHLGREGPCVDAIQMWAGDPSPSGSSRATSSLVAVKRAFITSTAKKANATMVQQVIAWFISYCTTTSCISCSQNSDLQGIQAKTATLLQAFNAHCTETIIENQSPSQLKSVKEAPFSHSKRQTTGLNTRSFQNMIIAAAQLLKHQQLNTISSPTDRGLTLITNQRLQAS